MTDNQLLALLITTLQPSVQSQWPTVSMLQKNQPTQQGVDTGPRVFFEKLFDKRYGFTGETFDLDVLPPGTPTWTPITTTYTQVIETTVQFSALVIQDPTNLALPTASDVAHYVAMLLSTDDILATLTQAGANVMRITQVTNPYFHDDRERFEAHPSFDVVFQHERDLSLSTPPIQAVDIDIYPI